MDVMRSNTSFFTSSEISEERLVYRHDDSESRRDAFHFVATSDTYSVRRPAANAASAADFQGHRFLTIPLISLEGKMIDELLWSVC